MEAKLALVDNAAVRASFAADHPDSVFVRPLLARFSYNAATGTMTPENLLYSRATLEHTDIVVIQSHINSFRGHGLTPPVFADRHGIVKIGRAAMLSGFHACLATTPAGGGYFVICIGQRDGLKDACGSCLALMAPGSATPAYLNGSPDTPPNKIIVPRAQALVGHGLGDLGECQALLARAIAAHAPPRARRRRGGGGRPPAGSSPRAPGGADGRGPAGLGGRPGARARAFRLGLIRLHAGHGGDAREHHEEAVRRSRRGGAGERRGSASRGYDERCVPGEDELFPVDHGAGAVYQRRRRRPLPQADALPH